MKLVGKSGSRDGNRAQKEKSIIRDHEISDAPFEDEDFSDILGSDTAIGGSTDAQEDTVTISELPDIMQYLEQQQPVLSKPVTEKQVKTTKPAAKKQPKPEQQAAQSEFVENIQKQQAKSTPTPQIFSYPDADLTPAQKAAIQRVVHKKKVVPDQAAQPDGSGAAQQNVQQSQQSRTPGETTGAIPQMTHDAAQIAEQNTAQGLEQGSAQGPAQNPAQNKRKAKKKKRRDIHAHSDRQLRKKGPPLKPVFMILILLVFLAGGGLYAWYYWWTEHATFEYTLHPIVILNGQTVEAGDFITPVEEMEHVTASFQNPGFRPQNGLQHVPLTLNLGLRSVEATTTLHVMTTVDRITHEYKEPGHDLRPVDFVANLDAAAGVPFYVQFVEQPKALEEYEVGEYTLHLTLNDAPFEALLVIVDTKPPTAVAVSKQIKAGETVSPTDFVEDVYDHSGIRSIEWVEAPHLALDRDQIVEILITDNHGNSAIFRGELSIILNEMPPVIEGVDTIISALGAPILYREGVTAFDDMGRDLTNEIQVDISGVDQFTVGVYKVIYFIEDATGFTDEVEATVHIIECDFEWLFKQIDDALESIRSGVRGNEVTQLDMVRGIHGWIGRTLRNPVEGEKFEINYAGAYRALRDGRGNYHNYSALAAVMLDRAGIENMLISRTEEAPASFRWNLVNPDDKGWHHFDAFPPRILIGSEAAFFTETKAKEFTKRYNDGHNIKDYYVYDKALFEGITIVE